MSDFESRECMRVMGAIPPPREQISRVLRPRLHHLTKSSGPVSHTVHFAEMHIPLEAASVAELHDLHHGLCSVTPPFFPLRAPLCADPPLWSLHLQIAKPTTSSRIAHRFLRVIAQSIRGQRRSQRRMRQKIYRQRSNRAWRQY